MTRFRVGYPAIAANFHTCRTSVNFDSSGDFLNSRLCLSVSKVSYKVIFLEVSDCALVVKSAAVLSVRPIFSQEF
jgi:hypothetical protein